MTSIDSLGLDRLDFIKIDVEGAQLQVLEGAAETIARTRPVIQCELHPARNEYPETADHMAGLGYRIEKLDRKNFLFLPPERGGAAEAADADELVKGSA